MRVAFGHRVQQFVDPGARDSSNLTPAAWALVYLGKPYEGTPEMGWLAMNGGPLLCPFPMVQPRRWESELEWQVRVEGGTW